MDGKDYNRLKWRCRRGMLELDVLLGRYLEQNWQSMNNEDRQGLRKLLDCSDQQLQGWLCEGKEPDTEVAAIVRAIRSADSH